MLGMCCSRRKGTFYQLLKDCPTGRYGISEAFRDCLTKRGPPHPRSHLFIAHLTVNGQANDGSWMPAFFSNSKEVWRLILYLKVLCWITVQALHLSNVASFFPFTGIELRFSMIAFTYYIQKYGFMEDSTSCILKFASLIFLSWNMRFINHTPN